MKHLNCEDILIYKYFAKIDSVIYVDTVRKDRAELPIFKAKVGGRKVRYIDDFLNAERNKYKNLRPSCGVIISDINIVSNNRFYFIVNIFSNSMSSSIDRVDYSYENKELQFLSYEFLEGT